VDEQNPFPTETPDQTPAGRQRGRGPGEHGVSLRPSVLGAPALPALVQTCSPVPFRVGLCRELLKKHWLGQNGGSMRFPFTAAAIVVLLLIACNGPTESATGTGPENTLDETPEHAESAPTDDAPLTPKSPDNTLIETPEYTGVIVSENGASEFSYLFDQDLTEFWEPSIDDVSRAEECIRQLLVSIQQNPELDAYQKEDTAFILENLVDYRRQYVGIVVDGEQRIWTNSFFSEKSFPDWRRVPVDVDGGGNHFWQIEYILPTDECIHFYVHGQS
jgi:hypothetical protein